MSTPPRIVAFVFCTYGLSWCIWFGLLGLSGIGLIDAHAPGRLYAWGGLAPSLVAMLLVLHADGWSELKKFASRVKEWRVPFRWYLYALLVPVLFRFLAIGIHSAGGGVMRIPRINPVMVLLAFVIGLIVPLMEEYGWRGYLQPGLRRRWSALAVGVAVGVAHWGWHIPLFWIEGTSLHGWGLITGIPVGLVGYAVATIALSLLITLMYEYTGGALFLAFVMHTAVNVSADVFGSAYRVVDEVPPLSGYVFAIAALGLLAAWKLRSFKVLPRNPVEFLDGERRG